MRTSFKKLTLISSLAIAFMAPAHAGIFSDDEARKAILDLRAKVDAFNDLHAKKLESLQTSLDAKADKRALLDIVNQIEAMHQEMAQLRGLVEVLTNNQEKSQKREQDFYRDLDTRLKKLEPQDEVVDGQEVRVGADEKAMYQAGIALFKKGDYKDCAQTLTEFIKRFPKSSYAPHAQHLIGNSFYALRDFKASINAQQLMVKTYPESSFAPEALLNASSSYIALKSTLDAKFLLKKIQKEYPDSEAAKVAKERLTLLK